MTTKVYLLWQHYEYEDSILRQIYIDKATAVKALDAANKDLEDRDEYHQSFSISEWEAI
jgi:hypothetical protein